MATAFDRVLVVDAPEELQLRRTAERDGLDSSEIRKIMGSQSTRAERLRAAQDVIRNDGDLEHLRDQIERLHRTYLGMAGESRVAGSP
jgi:dephospho-CoA kinase